MTGPIAWVIISLRQQILSWGSSWFTEIILELDMNNSHLLPFHNSQREMSQELLLATLRVCDSFFGKK